MNFLKVYSARKKQSLIFFVLSIVGAVAGIAHGVFFDLDFSQIKRLSLLGIVFTTVIVFPSLLFVEWIFDWNNRSEMEELRERIEKLEQGV